MPHRELGRRLLVVPGAGLVADQAAVLERDHAAAHRVDHLAVVGDDEHGRAGAVDPVEQLHDPDRGLGVEVSGRLVGEQQRRVVDEGARDRDALLLSAGELVGVVVDLRLEADEADDLRHLAADLGARGADHLQGVGDVVVDRAVGQQLEVLEDGADRGGAAAAPSMSEIRSMSRPAIITLPLAASTSRISILIRVDLPQPVGPTTKANSPRLTGQRDALEADVATGVDDGRLAQLDDRRAKPVRRAASGSPPRRGLRSGALAPLSCPQQGHNEASFFGLAANPSPGDWRPGKGRGEDEPG